MAKQAEGELQNSSVPLHAARASGGMSDGFLSCVELLIILALITSASSDSTEIRRTHRLGIGFLEFMVLNLFIR